MKGTIITKKDEKIIEFISSQEGFVGPTQIGLHFGQTYERASGYCSRNLKRLMSMGKLIKEKGKYKMKSLSIVLLFTVLLGSCSENYSNGERIGLITQFSKSGQFWKSWEGHLNMTQTGMNSSAPFDFSIDNDNEPDGLVKTLDSAANLGWKVKIVYHETIGKNWFHNRGETDHFVTKCEILDKTPVQTAFGGSQQHGKIIDTIYVVIDKSK